MNDKLENLKKSILVFDLETSSHYSDGTPVDIRTQFDEYVKRAKIKWFGCYSYKYDNYVCDQFLGNEEEIKKFIAEHDILVGFNNEEFDTPILYNNDVMPENKRYMQVDCLTVLGASTFQRHDGLAFKNRGVLMGHKAKSNSLKNWAKALELKTQKGDIDYKIFYADFWTENETRDIIKYLHSDVQATKEMFDKLWDFWMPFTKFLDEKNVFNLSWIKSSIASLTYKAACHAIGVEETYSKNVEKSKEEMGGRVIEPKYEEAKGVWYVDFASLYPHIYTMFNLFAEEKDLDYINKEYTWHGNDLFKVKGHYSILTHHPLSKDVAEKLKLRIKLKKEEPGHPLIYALKIFLNSLYGANRSPIFEQIHTPNGGWDCCWLGQQINRYTEKRMKDFGFETIAGDTDSIFVKLVNETKEMMKEIGFRNEEQYVKDCLKTIVDEIKDNVPFPVETFDIDIENYLEYVMWPFEDQPIEFDMDFNKFCKNCNEDYFDPMEIQEIYDHNVQLVQNGKQIKNVKNSKNKLIKVRKGKKKNYLYIYKKNGEPKLKIIGLPIIKDNATKLGPLILKEVLTEHILENKTAKFPKEQIEKVLEIELDKPEGLSLLAVEYKVKPDKDYKPNKDGTPSNNIYAQISRGYFNGQSGVISLIKNKKIGSAGKGMKYATVEEVSEAELTLEDIDLTKVRNELKPFIKEGE